MVILTSTHHSTRGGLSFAYCLLLLLCLLLCPQHHKTSWLNSPKRLSSLLSTRALYGSRLSVKSLSQAQYRTFLSSCGLLVAACEACTQPLAVYLLCNHDTLICHAAGSVSRQHQRKCKGSVTALASGVTRCVPSVSTRFRAFH